MRYYANSGENSEEKGGKRGEIGNELYRHISVSISISIVSSRFCVKCDKSSGSFIITLLIRVDFSRDYFLPLQIFHHTFYLVEPLCKNAHLITPFSHCNVTTSH